MQSNHIKVLDFMISETPVEPYLTTLKVARNRLLMDEARRNAGKRIPESWPYCSVCGAAYVAKPTIDLNVRDVVPACDCHAEPIWQGRPAENGWVYAIDPESVQLAAGSWKRLIGAVMGQL